MTTTQFVLCICWIAFGFTVSFIGAVVPHKLTMVIGLVLFLSGFGVVVWLAS